MNKDEFNEYLKTNYESLFNDLFKYCLSLVKNKDDAEDIVQDTFVKAIRYIENFESGNIKAWLFVILKNTYLTKIMKKTNQNELTKEAETSLEEHIDNELIIKYIDKLPMKLKEVFIYRHICNIKYKNIAKMLNISEGAAKMRNYDAKRLLKKYIKDNNL